MDCPHDGCTCLAAEGDEYCSDFCREHGSDHGPMDCGCGHADCAGTPALD